MTWIELPRLFFRLDGLCNGRSWLNLIVIPSKIDRLWGIRTCLMRLGPAYESNGRRTYSRGTQFDCGRPADAHTPYAVSGRSRIESDGELAIDEFADQVAC